MEEPEYDNIFAREDRHFYYVALHELVISLVKRHMGDGNEIDVLDAGCGTGALAVKLRKFGPVSAIDPHPLAINYCRQRGIRATKARIEGMPFKKTRFDLVTCMDVLVCARDDVFALKELARVTKSGGVIILRVSAHEGLRTGHDRIVSARRRYSLEELRKKMVISGWRVERITYMNLNLLPVLWVKSWRERIVKPNRTISNIGRVGWMTNFVMLTMQRIENWWLSRWNLPNGIGISVVGRKPIARYTP